LEEQPLPGSEAEPGQQEVGLEREGDSAAPAGWEPVQADPEQAQDKSVQADLEPVQGKWV